MGAGATLCPSSETCAPTKCGSDVRQHDNTTNSTLQYHSIMRVCTHHPTRPPTHTRTHTTTHQSLLCERLAPHTTWCAPLLCGDVCGASHSCAEMSLNTPESALMRLRCTEVRLAQGQRSTCNTLLPPSCPHAMPCRCREATP
jgi:hypothetical protein